VKLIADTGFLVAAINRHDHHLGSSEIPLRMMRQQFVRVEFDIAAEQRRLEELALRFRDRKPDLADLCLIRMSELHPKHSVVTIDVSDFRVYRRNQREVIPLLHPPGM
jgi:hypothetical protein